MHGQEETLELEQMQERMQMQQDYTRVALERRLEKRILDKQEQQLLQVWHTTQENRHTLGNKQA